MPLKTQSTGLETKTFIQCCVYKFKSTQELVNVPPWRKRKTIKYYMIKRIEEEKEEEEKEKEDKEEE